MKPRMEFTNPEMMHHNFASSKKSRTRIEWRHVCWWEGN